MAKSDNLDTKIISNTSFTKTITSLWILDGFSSLSRDTWKKSPMFPSSEKKNQWYVSAKFNNSHEFSLYLVPADTFDQKSVTVSVSFNVLNSKYEIVLFREFGPHTFTKPIGRGYPCFANVRELQPYVENDKLKLRIIIKADFPLNYFCKVQYENENPADTFIKDFQSMLSCGDFSDFTIQVQGEEIAVHKVVLAARSPVFNAMLKNEVLETRKGFVKIDDFSKNTISALVQYMYTIQVDIESDEDAKQLFFASDKYGLLDLKQLCENYMINHCSVENIFESLVFADENNAEHLKKGLLDLIAENKLSFKSLESLKASNSRQVFLKDLILAVLRE